MFINAADLLEKMYSLWLGCSVMCMGSVFWINQFGLLYPYVSSTCPALEGEWFVSVLTCFHLFLLPSLLRCFVTWRMDVRSCLVGIMDGGL